MDSTTLLRRPRTPDRRRRALEQQGWRTWLTYRENHRRDDEGRMVAVEECWLVELEHRDGTACTVSASSPAAAWQAAARRVSRYECSGMAGVVQ
jgi:hypothetical protein